MEYRGYHAKIEYSAEDEILFGTVIGISDNITFEGETVDELKQGFHNMIDDYLQLCEDIGKEPCKEFKGTFNVRIPSELHKAVFFEAAAQGVTLNQFVSDAIKKAVYEDFKPIYYVTKEKTLNVYEYTKDILKDEKQFISTPVFRCNLKGEVIRYGKQ